VAFVYWTAVRLCGAACWHYGKKRDENDLKTIMDIAKMRNDKLRGEVVP